MALTRAKRILEMIEAWHLMEGQAFHESPGISTMNAQSLFFAEVPPFKYHLELSALVSCALQLPNHATQSPALIVKLITFFP